MAYDGVIEISTKINNTGLTKGLVQSSKEINRLTSDFQKQVSAIKINESALATLRKRLDDITTGRAKPTELIELEAEQKKITAEIEKQEAQYKKLTDQIEKSSSKINEMKNKLEAVTTGITEPVALKNMQKQLDAIGKETKAVETENKALIEQYDKAVAILEEQRSLGLTEEQTKYATAEVDRLAQELIPVDEKLAEIDSKAQAIKNSMTELKLHPETSEEFKKLSEDITTATASLKETKNKAAEFSTEMEKPKSEISGIADRIKEIKLDPTISTDFVSLTESIKNTEHALRESKNQANKLKASITMPQVKQITDRIGNSFKNLSNNILKTFGFTKLFNKETSRASNNAKKAANGFGLLSNRISSLILAAFVFNVIQRGLASLQKYLGNVLMANEQFVSSLNSIKVNLLTAFAPIWDAILPGILGFMNVLAKATAILSQFVALLFGKTINQARASAEAIDKQAHSLDKVEKSAKKASGQLSTLDELQTITQDSSSDAADTLEGLDWGDFSDIEETATIFDGLLETLQPIIDALERLKIALEPFKTFVAQGLKDFIDMIAKPVAIWLVDIGIPALIDTLTNILNAVDWPALNKAFADLWAAMEPFGKTIGEGLLAFLKAIEKFGSWALGEGLRDFLRITKELFNNIDWGRLSNSINNFFEALGNFSIEVGKALIDFYKYFLAPLITWTLSEAFPRLIDGLTWLMNNIDWAYLREALVIFWKALEPFAETVGEGLLWFYENVVIPFFGWVGNDFLPEFLKAIAAVIKGLDQDVKILGDAFISFWNLALKPLMGFIGDVIISFLKWVQDNGKLVADLIIGLATAFIAFKAAIMITELVTNLSTAIGVLFNNLDLIGGLSFATLGIALAAFVALNDLSPELTLALDLLAGALTAIGVAWLIGFGPIGWIAGAVAGLGVAIVSLITSINKDFIPAVQRFGDEISESTKNMLDPIIDNADEARKKLTELFITSKPIVAEDTAEIAGYFKDMADTAMSELEKMRNAAVENLAAIFGEEAKNYEKRIAEANKSYDAMIAEVERKDKSLEDSVRKAKVQFGEESKEYKIAVQEFEKHNSEKIAEIDKINTVRDEELEKIKQTAGEGLTAYIENKDEILKTYEEKEKGIKDSYEALREEQKKYLEEGGSLDDEHYKEMVRLSEQFLTDIENGIIKSDAERISLQNTRNNDLLALDTLHTNEILKNARQEHDDLVAEAREKFDDLFEREKEFQKDATNEQRRASEERIKQAQQDRDNSIKVADEKYTAIVKGSEKMGNDVVEAQNKMNRTFEQKWKDFWSGIGNWFKSLWDGITSWFSNLWDSLTGKAQTGASNIQGATGFSGQRFSASIPGFADGLDYVPYNNFLANLHKGERVLTATENKDYSNMMNLFQAPIINPSTINTIAEKGRFQSVALSSGNTSWIKDLTAQIATQGGSDRIESLLEQLISVVQSKNMAVNLDGQTLLASTERANTDRGIVTGGSGFVNAY